MKRSKILFSIFFVIAPFFINLDVARAETVSFSDDNVSKIEEGAEVVGNEEVASRLALDFAKTIEPTLDLTIGSTTPIRDVEGVTVGYDIAFNLDTEQYGYVIIDFRLQDDYISQFSIERGVPDYYTQMTKQLSNEVSDDTNAEILETMPTEYNVVVEDEVFRSDGEELTLQEFENYQDSVAEEALNVVEESQKYATSAMYGHSSEFFIDYPSDFQMSSVYYLRQFNSITQDYTLKVNKKYACAVVALATIASSYNFYSTAVESQYKAAYDRLWTLAYTSNEGLTQTRYIGPALVNYAREKGVTLTQTTTPSPSFVLIQNAIAQSYPVALSVFYNKTNGGGVSGHTVFVQGTMTGKRGQTMNNFIILSNGWTASATYMNYSTVPSTLYSYEAAIWKGKKLFY
ncbi:hypothetical protein LI951_00700 [Enterococcus sp. BWT-B8]|uniref:hypothetical protein n=1 Tax=Enterococcus sp. BWT-B8 TaxID=2885157 RepID=UPI001E500C53|nr:hypothetical protein [Enterococcus sp. BWT-B8]MCB5950578.1 hypothetical protein [Enterococcus sp. BWT-B8]